MGNRRAYAIHPEVFAAHPNYIRGVVITTRLTNGSSPLEMVSLLREAEDVSRSQFNLDQRSEHRRFASWREAYRSFGAKPSKFRPSMEAMIRRILRGDRIPSIRRLADIGNVGSIRHALPAGGHSTDVMGRDIELRPAHGAERFIPFGSDLEEHPEPGEIEFAECDAVLTRRWTWRQATYTLLVEDTTDALFNVDGLPPVVHAEVEGSCVEISELLQEFCGAETRVETLTSAMPCLLLQAISAPPIRSASRAASSPRGQPVEVPKRRS